MVAAPCARWQLVRGPERKSSRGRPFNGIVRRPFVSQRRTVMMSWVVLMFSGAGIAAEPAGDEVWVWFAKCEKPRQVVLEMTLDDRLVHRSQFPACFTQRAEIDQKRVEFPLSPRKSQFGEPAGSALEVNVWEAGGETNGMMLGVSFMSTQRVWLNTLHFAAIDRPSSRILAPGIVVKTYPVENAKAF